MLYIYIVNHMCETDLSNTFDYRICQEKWHDECRSFLACRTWQYTAKVRRSRYITGHFAADGLAETSRKHCKTAAALMPLIWRCWTNRLIVDFTEKCWRRVVFFGTEAMCWALLWPQIWLTTGDFEEPWWGIFHMIPCKLGRFHGDIPSGYLT